MKVPGRAWLQWEARPEDGGTRLVQTALFEPVGLAGTLYWYLLYPLHRRIFSDLVQAVGREAGRGAGTAAARGGRHRRAAKPAEPKPAGNAKPGTAAPPA